MIRHETVRKNCELVTRRNMQYRRHHLLDEGLTLEVMLSFERAGRQKVLMQAHIVESNEAWRSHGDAKNQTASATAGGP